MSRELLWLGLTINYSESDIQNPTDVIKHALFRVSEGLFSPVCLTKSIGSDVISETARKYEKSRAFPLEDY